MALTDDRKHIKAFVYNLLESVKDKRLVEVDNFHINPPMLSNMCQNLRRMHVSLCLSNLRQDVKTSCIYLSNMSHTLHTSNLRSLVCHSSYKLGAIQSRFHRLCLQVRLVYGVLQQEVLTVFAGCSLLNPPHAIFVIKKKLVLADTRILDVARMLKATMFRIKVPPMCGNDATAYTHPAFVFNIGMGNQKFAEFKRCNPSHNSNFEF